MRRRRITSITGTMSLPSWMPGRKPSGSSTFPPSASCWRRRASPDVRPHGVVYGTRQRTRRLPVCPSTPSIRTPSSGRSAWKGRTIRSFRTAGRLHPGLSALDLLFNEGPDSILWLKRRLYGKFNWTRFCISAKNSYLCTRERDRGRRSPIFCYIGMKKEDIILAVETAVQERGLLHRGSHA